MFRKFIKALLILAGLVFAVSMYNATVSDNQRATELAGPLTPQRFAELSFDEAGAAPQVTAAKGAFKIVYNIDPWALTNGTMRSTNLSFADQIVPDFFEKFPEAQSVEIVAMGQFKDLKGNESRGRVVDLVFTRANAGMIRFDNIAYSDIPRIADSYWEHPSLSKP